MPSDIRNWQAGKGQNQPQLRIMRASHPQVNEKPRSAGVPPAVVRASRPHHSRPI